MIRSSRSAALLAGPFLLVAVFCLRSADVGGQSPPSAYRLRLSAQQIEAVRQAWNDRLRYVPGDVLVRFRDGATSAARTRAMAAVRGGVDVQSARWIGDVLWLKSAQEPDSERVAATLGRQPEVLWAQPNYLRRLSMVPNDSGYVRQWNFDLIDVPKAWDIDNGASDRILVAVIDSGVTTVTEQFSFRVWGGQTFEDVTVPFRINPDLDSGRIAPGLDFMFWDGPVVDMVGHGTHVAGTILEETNNGIAQAGIAYRARLLPLKACFGYWELQFAQSQQGIPGFVRPEEEGGCADAAVAQAVRYAADAGANIINLSLGGPDPAPVMLDALRYAVEKGAFVAIAVGNEFTTGNPISYPAAYAADLDGVVAVGAVGPSGQRAFYSNTGSYLEIVAPGGDAREGGLPATIYQSSLFGSDFDPARIIRPRFDRYAESPSQGTSMAAPHVAGVAALLVSHGLTRPSALEAAIEGSARDLGPAGRDEEYGYGLVNAAAALRLAAEVAGK